MRVLSRGCHIVDVLRLRDDLPRFAVAVLEFLQKQEASGVVFLREVLHHAQVGGNGEHEAESHASDRLPVGVLDDEIRLLLLRERGNGREVIEAVDTEKDAAHELIVLLVLHIRHLRFDGLQLVDVDLIDGIEVQRSHDIPLITKDERLDYSNRSCSPSAAYRWRNTLHKPSAAYRWRNTLNDLSMARARTQRKRTNDGETMLYVYTARRRPSRLPMHIPKGTPPLEVFRSVPARRDAPQLPPQARPAPSCGEAARWRCRRGWRRCRRPGAPPPARR